MKHSLLAISLLAAVSPLALAQDDYSSLYSHCMNGAQTTLDMNNCNAAEIDRQDKRLNGAYKKAMAGLASAQQGTLRDAQRAWIKYRDANCAVYSSLTGGTIDQLNGAGCLLQMSKARADELSALFEP